MFLLENERERERERERARERERERQIHPLQDTKPLGVIPLFGSSAAEGMLSTAHISILHFNWVCMYTLFFKLSSLFSWHELSFLGIYVYFWKRVDMFVCVCCLVLELHVFIPYHELYLPN